MSTLSQCRGCHGFVPPAHATCLHCGAALPRRRFPAGRAFLQLLLGLAGAGAASLTLMACYGLPPCEPEDLDGKDDPSYCREPMEYGDAGVDAGADAGPDAGTP